MNAVITGASSGIGRAMAIRFAQMGYHVFGIARREDKLDSLKSALGDSFTPIAMDVSRTDNIYALFDMLDTYEIDIFVNNAGFGLYGEFAETDLERELSMIDVNIRSLHILSKLFLKKFIKQDHGRLLNVGSSAGFMMGPKLSAYYATKAYVLRLSEALDEEMRRVNKNITVSVLCPGPVKTEFDSVADVSFSLKGLSAEYVADYAVKKLLRGKRIIIPGITTKLLVFASRFIPSKVLSKITYCVQSKKGK